MPKKDPALVELSRIAKELREDMEAVGATLGGFYSILKVNLDQIGDSRQQAKVCHVLTDVVAIVFFGLLAGIDEWDEMEVFAREQEDFLSTLLELPNGIPSHDTIQRVFSIIEPKQMQEMLVLTLQGLISSATRDIKKPIYQDDEICIDDICAVDGKETSGTGRPDAEDVEDRRNLNQLNVQSTEYGITLSSTRISEKSNEIPETQRVLKMLDLKGCVVTADALNTQKETARVICEEAGADYCLALKANQKGAWNDVVEYFSDDVARKELKAGEYGGYLCESEETSSRIVTREYMISDEIGWFADKDQWCRLRSIGHEKKTITDKKKGTTTEENRYFICSFPAKAELFAIVVRRHWHVENLLHWVLDVTFKEDRQRTRNKKALENLSLVRRFVISILKILKEYYAMSYNKIRRKIGRNFEQEIPVIFATLRKLYGTEEE